MFCRNKGRHGTKYTEEMEDQALLADEDTGGERAGHRLMVQPSVVKGGTMREYQMQGLNWLIHLYDNGINGILADEMVSFRHKSPILVLPSVRSSVMRSLHAHRRLCSISIDTPTPGAWSQR